MPSFSIFYPTVVGQAGNSGGAAMTPTMADLHAGSSGDDADSDGGSSFGGGCGSDGGGVGDVGGFAGDGCF